MAQETRTRLKSVALKQEVTPGVDVIAGSPVQGDFVTCQSSMRLLQDQQPNPVENGGYDDAAPIPGGLRAELTLTIPMAGSGDAATAPEWGKLLKACRMGELATGAAVGAPTAATAASASTATAAAPFGTTAGAYVGMPILITGNPAAGAQDVVMAYNASRVITLGNTYSPVLSTGSLLQIPPNVLYKPISDEASEVGFTAYCYEDKLLSIFLGLRGSWAVGLRAGASASIVLRMMGIVAQYRQPGTDPGLFKPVTRQAPRWAGGISRLNRKLAAAESASWDMGVRTYFPENPEAAEGYNVPRITGAAPRITMNPFSHGTDTGTRASAYRAGTPIPVAAMWGGVAGNRFALSCPSGQVVDLQPAERAELGVDALVIAPDTVNNTMYLACF